MLGNIIYTPATSAGGNFVPYAGAVADVDLGAFSLYATDFYINNGAFTAQLTTAALTANRVITFQNATGTVAFLSDLASYVPYTGATADVDLGTHILSAKSLQVKGTAGNGHLALKHQSANATAGGQETALFADSNGDIKWKIDGNFYSTLKMSGNTADRVYTFQNSSGTVAFLTDIPSTIKLSSIAAATTTNTIDNTNYAQVWNWSTLTTQTALNFTANSITTGNLLSLTASGTGHTTGYLLNVATSGANAASATTTTAAYFSNTRTGTTSTNVAAQFVASGATNNIALYVSTGLISFGTLPFATNEYFTIKTSFSFPFQIYDGTNQLTIQQLNGTNRGFWSFRGFEIGDTTAAYEWQLRSNNRLLTLRSDHTNSSPSYNTVLMTFDAPTSNVGIGMTVAASARLHVISTTEQLRIGYDTTNYFSTTVASTGITTFNLTAGAGTPYFIFSKDISMNEGINFRFGGTTGTKLGTSTSDKLAFWNKTPIIQPTNAIAKAAYVSVGGSAVSSDDTFGTYSIGQAIQALINVGILA